MEESIDRKPNEYVPHNVCSSGKFLLAGRRGVYHVSLEGKCCCEKCNSEYVRGFQVYNSCFGYISATSFSFNYALGPHPKWPVMSGDAFAGKLPSKSGCRL